MCWVCKLLTHNLAVPIETQESKCLDIEPVMVFVFHSGSPAVIVPPAVTKPGTYRARQENSNKVV